MGVTRALSRGSVITINIVLQYSMRGCGSFVEGGAASACWFPGVHSPAAGWQWQCRYRWMGRMHSRGSCCWKGQCHGGLSTHSSVSQDDSTMAASKRFHPARKRKGAPGAKGSSGVPHGRGGGGSRKKAPGGTEAMLRRREAMAPCTRAGGTLRRVCRGVGRVGVG